MARAPADQLDAYSLADLVKLQQDVEAAISQRPSLQKVGWSERRRPTRG